MISRRGLIGGLATLLAAPAIVRASRLMAVKPWPNAVEPVEFAPDVTGLLRPIDAWRVRLSGEDAFGNYKEEIIAIGKDESAFTINDYSFVNVEYLDPIIIPRNVRMRCS